MSEPVMIEVALNGETPKQRNPRVPRSPGEVRDDALLCIEAGASIVHNHTDDPVFADRGRHDSAPYRAAWEEILEVHPDTLLYPTMASGGPHTTIDERTAHIRELAALSLLRFGVVDPGSLNIDGALADGRPKGQGALYENRPADIETMLALCREHALGPSLSIFEPGFLRVALAYHRAGALPRGALIKLYFGGERALFGLPPTRAALDAYLEMLEGSGLPWSVALLGGDVVASGLAEWAIGEGGHVRVGLEDYAGPDQPGNANLVEELVRVAARCGRAPASARECATILDLPPRPT